jgi:hypothetical protein
MTAPRICRKGIVLLLSLLSAEGCAADAVNPFETLDRQLEEMQMARLALVQANPTNRRAEFSTDGCSGGLSEGWTVLSKHLPVFQEKFGEKPPYEFCCVDHDRAYWRGDSRDGFSKRLQADETLRHCVMEYGREHRGEFAREFNLSEQTIVHNFTVISDLMYYAVRLGGKPCSYLPWRWGYGWPECPLPDVDTKQVLY